MGVDNDFGNQEKVALEGTATMEEFFRLIKMPTSINELDINATPEEIQEMAYKCSGENTKSIGNFQVLNMKDMEKIYIMAK